MPPPPGLGEVLVHVTARAMHAIDLRTVTGAHRSSKDASVPLFETVRPGLEGVGEIVALSPRVARSSRLRLGMRVAFFPARYAWSEIVTVAEKFATPVPDDMPDEVAGQIHRVPLMAMMLFRCAQLSGASKNGGAIVVSAAGSSVGRILCALLSEAGLPLVALVRRADAVAEFHAMHKGLRCIATSNPNWPRQLVQALDGRPLHVIVDPVGGDLATELIEKLDRHGTFLTYGDLSGERMTVDTMHLASRFLSIKGLSVDSWANLGERVRRRDIEQIFDLARRRPELFPVAGHYDLAEISQAAAHVQDIRRRGCVVLTS